MPALRRLHLRGLPAYAARSAIGLQPTLEMHEPPKSAHLRAVYEMIPEITGLRLPVVERSLHTLCRPRDFGCLESDRLALPEASAVTT